MSLKPRDARSHAHARSHARSHEAGRASEVRRQQERSEAPKESGGDLGCDEPVTGERLDMHSPSHANVSRCSLLARGKAA